MRRRASSLYLRSSSASGSNAEVDSGRVDVRRVIAVGLDLSVTEDEECWCGLNDFMMMT